jgi:alpha-tubulin suppressor-like RCC1 family protein
MRVGFVLDHGGCRQIVSGKYHTLMLSESSSVFACGDNTYGAVGVPSGGATATDSVAIPTMVALGFSEVKGTVRQIAASGFASFALVGTCLLF